MNNKDWKGNTQAVMKNIGASNHSNNERQSHDFYATEPKALELLLKLETFNNVWECAVGNGHLANVLQKHNILNRASDLVVRDYPCEQLDFLAIDNLEYNGDIITNPPYRYANEFILKAINIINTNNKLALLLPIRYLEGKARKQIFRTYPPKIIYVSSGKIKCAINGNFKQMTGSAVGYAWFVWQKGYKGKSIIDWFN